MQLGKVIVSFRSKKGNDVVIRYPKWEDLRDLLIFANNLSREDTFVLLNGKKITKTEEIKWLTDTIAAMEKGKRIHLVATVNGKFAANCGITIDRMRKAHVGEINISVAAAYREEGIGVKLLVTLIALAKARGLRLLTLTCMENNSRALHVYEKVGFKRAGLIPGACSYRGKYYGEYMLYLSLQ